MARLDGDDMRRQRPPDQAQVADQIQQFVAGQFVGETQRACRSRLRAGRWRSRRMRPAPGRAPAAIRSPTESRKCAPGRSSVVVIARASHVQPPVCRSTDAPGNPARQSPETIAAGSAIRARAAVPVHEARPRQSSAARPTAPSAAHACRLAGATRQTARRCRPRRAFRRRVISITGIVHAQTGQRGQQMLDCLHCHAAGA